jgi:hypothetical protein
VACMGLVFACVNMCVYSRAWCRYIYDCAGTTTYYVRRMEISQSTIGMGMCVCVCVCVCLCVFAFHDENGELVCSWGNKVAKVCLC